MAYKKLDFNTEDLESLSNSDLKKVADYSLRHYLLKTVNIPQFCPIKKRLVNTFNMQVAHFIDRQCMALRYDLKNCHLISKFSNEFDAQIQVEDYKSKHHKEYAEFLVSEYGSDVLNYLAEKSKELKLFKQEDYIKVIKQFRDA
jgi:hypothetical protein